MAEEKRKILVLYITENIFKLPAKPCSDIGRTKPNVREEFKDSAPDLINAMKKSIANDRFLKPLP